MKETLGIWGLMLFGFVAGASTIALFFAEPIHKRSERSALPTPAGHPEVRRGKDGFYYAAPFSPELFSACVRCHGDRWNALAGDEPTPIRLVYRVGDEVFTEKTGSGVPPGTPGGGW